MRQIRRDAMVMRRDTLQRVDNKEILLNGLVAIDSGLLCLTYCHRVGIIPLVMSCLPREIVCCS